VVVPPQRLVGGFLLSGEWLVTFGFTVAGIVVSLVFDALAYAIPGLLPLIIGAVSLVGRRVISMFHFTLAESSRGLRITRGLTNLTSQSVPLNRVQGVRVTQPLLWRRAGWYRLDVDILGYGGGDSQNNESQATGVLLPVATGREVALTLARVLPGVDLDAIAMHPAPRRARWVSWLDFWTLRYGWDARVLVTEHGWVTHHRDIVPHAKTQSVRVVQGPLQRRLRLAHVHVDTTRGPVDVVARHLDAGAARALALSQLDRARGARQAERAVLHAGAGGADVSAAGDAPVLARFGVDTSARLGAGGEATVYALDERRVLRVYHGTHEGPATVVPQLTALYAGWQGVDIGLELPRVLDAGEVAGRSYSIDRRMSGIGFSTFLAAGPPEDERRVALLSYLDAAAALPRLPSPVPGFARLIGSEAPRAYGSLGELLSAQLHRALAVSRGQLERDLPDVRETWARLFADLAERRCAPALVHGDLCPPNVFVSRGADGQPRVTGVGDFSPHTLAADPLMDLTGAIAFLELEGYPEAAADARWLQGVAEERYGPEIGRWVEVYRVYYAFYFSMAYAVDPPLYAWCLRQLGSELWVR
ncbi:MAG: PH domain-containing protein, partial [Actinomycetes bacterium]